MGERLAREKEEEREDHQSWLQHWPRWWEVQDVGCRPRLHEGTQEIKFSLCKFILLDLLGNGSEVSGVMICPPLVHPFGNFLTHSCACPVLLCLSPVARRRMFVTENCCPTSVLPPSPAISCSLSQQVLASNPGWLHTYLTVFETYIFSSHLIGIYTAQWSWNG